MSAFGNKRYNAQCQQFKKKSKELLNWSQIKVRKRKNQADWTTLSGDIDRSWRGWTKWSILGRNRVNDTLMSWIYKFSKNQYFGRWNYRAIEPHLPKKNCKILFRLGNIGNIDKNHFRRNFPYAEFSIASLE